MQTTLKILACTALLALLAAALTAVNLRTEWVETWQWDDAAEKYSSEVTELPVRGWPLYFIIHSPRGARFLCDPFIWNAAGFAVPSFLVVVAVFGIRRRKRPAV